ncbi:MAG: hypothetical protein AAGC44_09830 [Planctomycetota bacterium]
MTLLALLAASLVAAPTISAKPAQELTKQAPDPALSPVTDEGYDDLSAGKTFYLDVPMIDVDGLGGIGDAITAESIINSVRFAGLHPEINHIVFRMDTGGGKVFHADAMARVIEQYHDKMEYHIVIEDAISAGIWTVFSCDNIFMTERGSIGGAVMYITHPDGSVQESPHIPIVAAQLQQLAERNGHPGALVPAMMHMPAELHYWKENGRSVLSNTPPRNPRSADGYDAMDRRDEVLTLTSQQAIAIGLAKPIDRLDAGLVGEKIGVPDWTRANHYGQVIDEIAQIYNITMPLYDEKFIEKINTPFVRPTRELRNNPDFIAFQEERRSLEKMVVALEQITDALNRLPDCHPERHIWFEGPGGKTVVADPEQWRADAAEAMALCAQLDKGMRDFRTALRMGNKDLSNADDINAYLERIKAKVQGIARLGNAGYWAAQQ